MNKFKQLKFCFILSVLLIFVVSVSKAQTKIKVSGTVISSTGETLPGVAIKELNSKVSSQTDINGKYVIVVPSNTTLVFSYLGFQNVTRAINGKTEVNITMLEDIKLLEQVVVVGYGTQKKKEITGAITSVKSEDIDRLATGNFQEALQGLSGVNVTNAGAPGDPGQIVIRGFGSVVDVAGANEPLYVVDGIPFQGAPNLNPNEIESIEVLKDAASAAIYGTRASNGIILITTKKGKAGEVKVNFDSYYGVQNITSGLPLANSIEQLYIYNTVNQNNATPNTLINAYSRNNSSIDYNTDWIKIFLNNNAPVQNYNFRIGGGTESLTYSVNASYFNQDGSIINSNADRGSIRANTSFKKKKFDVNTSINLQQRNSRIASTGIFRNAYGLDPFRPAPNFDEDRIQSVDDNPDGVTGAGVSLINLAQNVKANNSTKNYELFGAVNAKYSILKNLIAGVNLGGNFTNNNRTNFTPSFIIFNAATGQEESTPRVSNLTQITDNNIRYTSEYSLNYFEKFGQHSINLFALYSREQNSANSQTASVDDLFSNSLRVLSAGKNNPRVFGDAELQRLTGQLFRAQYNYKEKYLLSASIRRDGSSLFGSNNQFALFPSVSVGWNLSDESFFKVINKNDFISSLKIRASYGAVGNQRIPAFTYAAFVEPRVNYVFGNANSTDQTILSEGVSGRKIPNADVKWETSITQNLGFDFAFLKNKLTFSAELYNRESRDLLLPIVVPPSAGTNIPPTSNTAINTYRQIVKNVGNIVNKGIELDAGYRFKTKKLSYTINATFTKNSNLVTKLTNPDDVILGSNVGVGVFDPITIIKEGLPAGAFYLLRSKGVIKDDQQLAIARVSQPTARLGDLFYDDVNRDNRIDDKDKQYFGNSNPKWESGLNLGVTYKNISLNVSLYGVYGLFVYNEPRYQSYNTNRNRELLYQWSPQNTSSDIPAVRNTRLTAGTDYFIEKGDYIRLRNVNLRYGLPQNINKKLGINGASIFVSGINLLTITGYTGFDPEIGGNVFNRGVDRFNYPIARQFRTGIAFNF